MPYKIVIIFIFFFQFTCAQNKEKIIVGGVCEGCKAVYESPVSFDKLNYIDTLPDFNEEGPKMEISGVIYKSDGVTPAGDVVMYVYHTDQKGYYSRKGNEAGWGKRHGYIREWLKTNDKGEYKFYTLKPAAYPSANAPAHIHPTIKEDDKNEYWIDDYVFEGDEHLTKEYKNNMQERGSVGIINVTLNNGLLIGKRDIMLGKNIPDYPK